MDNKAMTIPGKTPRLCRFLVPTSLRRVLLRKESLVFTFSRPRLELY